MGKSESLSGTLQNSSLSEYLTNNNISLELLDTIKEIFTRANKVSAEVICVQKETVLHLTGPSLLLDSSEADIPIDVISFEQWRNTLSAAFETEYDRMRFMRRTSLNNLIIKSIDHAQYSFVAPLRKSKNECFLQYDFIKLDPKAQFILCVSEEVTSSLEHDTLTGGLNRKGLLRELSDKFAGITSPDQYSLLYFNIQNFHHINEQYGTGVGDMVLNAMYTSMVYSNLHPISYGRMESDKFICLIDRKNLDVEEIGHLCHQECEEGDVKVMFTCICGIYHVQHAGESPVNACDYAKTATSYIKDRYLQPCIEFNPKMQKTDFSDTEILSMLDDAIANNEFGPYFQPIVDTKTGRIVMAEALVRWKSISKGMVSPGVFIPVLERHGGLSRIDMVMEKRIYNLQKKRRAEGLPVVPVDINFSWVDFADSSLLAQIYEHIVDPDSDNDLVRYEITESALADIAENRYDVLDFFKQHQVKLTIDDFGQAYSFGTMKDVDFSIVKIDKSMIDQIGTTRKANLLIETMISMFHKMNAKVVAEGVETEKQVNYLKEAGCDFIQGYYFYRPMDEESYLKVLEENKDNLGQIEEAEEIVPVKPVVKEEDPHTLRSKAKSFWMPFSSVKLEDLKSTFMIVGICGLLSAVIYFSTYRLVSNLVTASCDEITVRDIDKIKLHIDLELSTAQEALSAFSMAVFQNGLDIPNSEEEIYQQMERFLGNTPILSGIVAGFEDSVFPEYADKLGFGPLIRNQGDSLVRYQVGEIRDFRKTKEWYSECYAQGQSRWSAPFFSEEGDIIIDYSIPLKNAEGEVVGVVAADLSISHLREIVEDIKPYPASIVMIMQPDLTFVIHPDKGYPMHKSLPVYLKEREIAIDSTLLNALHAGDIGKKILAPKGEELFIYYDIIDKAGYRLLIESQSSDVYGSLNDISRTMKWIGFGGLLFLILTLGFMIYDNKMRERKTVERNMRILRHTADTDGLTGLNNRTAGERLITEMIDRRVPGFLAVLDCDKFKLVNDHYGHASGDILLQKLSAALQYCFPDDITMRLGGDEFAIFCHTTKDKETFEEKVKVFFVEVNNIRIEGMGDYSPSVSMGAAAYYGEETVNFDRLYKIADRRLYTSKKSDGCTLTME